VAAALIASAALGATGASAAPPVAADAAAVTHWNQLATSPLAAIPAADGGAPPAFQINMGMTHPLKIWDVPRTSRDPSQPLA
jgi:hypothetical protein